MNMLSVYEAIWRDVASEEERRRNARDPLPFILAKLQQLGQAAGHQLEGRELYRGPGRPRRLQ